MRCQTLVNQLCSLFAICLRKGRMINRTLLIVLLNAASASAIILVNKHVFRSGFPFGTALTAFHLIFTHIALSLFRPEKGGESKKLTMRQVLPCAISYAVCMPLQNISLQLNSVGSNQVAKFLTIPVAVVTQYWWMHAGISLKVFFSLAITCLGTAVFMSADVEFGLVGAIASLLMVAATCFNQITIEQNSKQLQVPPNVLLSQCTPFAIVVLIVSSLLFERSSTGDLPIFVSFTPALVGWIILSAILGLVVNLTTFAIVGKLSALTYKVLAHLKSCIIFGGSVFFLGSSYTLTQMLGFLITMAGVSCYVWLQHMQPKSTPEVKKEK